MLYHFLLPFTEQVSFFNVVKYITFRAGIGMLTALGISFLFSPWFIRRLQKKQIGQQIRELGPESHFSKAGTPTMGGGLILIAILLPAFLWMDLTNPFFWYVFAITLGYGILGFLDDYWKITKKNTKGVSGKVKLFWQFLLALSVTGCIYFRGDIEPQLLFPYLNYPFILGSGELTIFSACLVGAGLGFLWYNTYPAQVFMGDVGSLSLGGALGTLAVCTHHEIILAIVGGIFVIEALSVITQVASFKTTGKRVFKMAPIHHHFELKGWPEPKVIVRFWIISIILAMIGLLSLKLR